MSKGKGKDGDRGDVRLWAGGVDIIGIAVNGEARMLTGDMRLRRRGERCRCDYERGGHSVGVCAEFDVVGPVRSGERIAFLLVDTADDDRRLASFAVVVGQDMPAGTSTVGVRLPVVDRN